MRRIVGVCFAAGALAVAASCADMVSPDEAADRALVGVYSISTVNGSGLPITLGVDDTASVDLISGTITLRQDKSFTDIINVKLTTPSGVTLEADTARGNYSRLADTLKFAPTDGHDNYQAVANNATLTESSIEFVIVYHKN